MQSSGTRVLARLCDASFLLEDGYKPNSKGVYVYMEPVPNGVETSLVL